MAIRKIEHIYDFLNWRDLAVEEKSLLFTHPSLKSCKAVSSPTDFYAHLPANSSVSQNVPTAATPAPVFAPQKFSALIEGKISGADVVTVRWTFDRAQSAELLTFSSKGTSTALLYKYGTSFYNSTLYTVLRRSDVIADANDCSSAQGLPSSSRSPLMTARSGSLSDLFQTNAFEAPEDFLNSGPNKAVYVRQEIARGVPANVWRKKVSDA